MIKKKFIPIAKEVINLEIKALDKLAASRTHYHYIIINFNAGWLPWW